MSWYNILKFLGIAIVMGLPLCIAEGIRLANGKEESPDSEDEFPEFKNPIITTLYVVIVVLAWGAVLFGVLGIGGLVFKLVKLVSEL